MTNNSISSDFLRVGDVFTSSSLASANFTHDRGVVNRKVLQVNGEKSVKRCWTENGPDGWKRSRQDIVDLDGFDESRGRAEFVVIATTLNGGGTGHGPRDVFPDGWGVYAKRLAPDGQYDPDGEEVFFRQSGCFSNLLYDVIKKPSR